MILKRGRLTYYVKDEAVIVGISDFQFTAYTVYPLQNRKPFYDFRKAILKSADQQYSTPVELIGLAKRFNLRGVASHKPSEQEMEKFKHVE